MAQRVIIKIDFHFSDNKLLKIPEETRVPLGTQVRWEVHFSSETPLRLNLRRLLFNLYFPKRTPFDWKTSRAYTDRYFWINDRQHVLLAEDHPDEKGDFKYGVQVIDPKNDEVLEDEDPILKVF